MKIFSCCRPVCILPEERWLPCCEVLRCWLAFGEILVAVYQRVAVGVVVEADSEKGENKTENTPKSDGKEHDEADNKGKKDIREY